MMRRAVLAAAGVLVPLVAAQVQSAPRPAPKKVAKGVAQAPQQRPDEVQVPDFPKIAGAAVSKSLALLQNSSATFDTQKACVSCHHQMLTAWAVDYARLKGFQVNETQAKAQTANFARQMNGMKDLFRLAERNPAAEKQLDQALVDPPMTGGYLFTALQASGYPKDEHAGRLAAYLGRKQQEDGRWAVVTPRPPQQSSDFAATALAVRAIRFYTPTAQAEETDRRVARAREWMTAHPPKTGEDRAFRLMGLVWSGAPEAEIRKGIAGLLDTQQDDGGWTQLDGKDTDAYATSISLVALNQAGVPGNHPEYIKGVVYLAMRQRPEGSWWVVSRAHPAQPYFESGFPHKKDQFISAAATAWAVMALIPTAEVPSLGAATVQR